MAEKNVIMIRPADGDQLSLLAHEWLDRVRHGTDADLAALEAWIAEDIRHEDAYERAQTYDAAVGHLRREDLNPKLLEPLDDERLPGPAGWRRRFRSQAIWLGAAATAGLALLVILAVIPPGDALDEAVSTGHQTETSELRRLSLQDGTSAFLGAKTDLSFEIIANTRVVTLNGGAAYFTVAPDPTRPFTVKAGALHATALGTRFDVRRDGGVYRVAVAEGTVRVSYPKLLAGRETPSRQSLELSMGQQIRATRSQGLEDIEPIDPANVGAWREAKLIYQGATLTELVAVANRYYDRPILIEVEAEIANRQLSGTFRSDDIDGLLSMIDLSFPATVDRSQVDHVLITQRSPD